MSEWGMFGLLVILYIGLYLPLLDRLKRMHELLLDIRKDVQALKHRVEYQEEMARINQALDEEMKKAADISERMRREGFYDGAGKWYPPGSEIPE